METPSSDLKEASKKLNHGKTCELCNAFILHIKGFETMADKHVLSDNPNKSIVPQSKRKRTIYRVESENKDSVEEILTTFEREHDFLRQAKGGEPSHGEQQEQFPSEHFNVMNTFNIDTLDRVINENNISGEILSKIQPILKFHNHRKDIQEGKIEADENIGWDAAVA